MCTHIRSCGWVFLVTFAGCASTPRSAPTSNLLGFEQDASLLAAADAFYSAETPEAMAQALAEAESVDPEAPLVHELNAVWAQFAHNHPGVQFDFNMKALLAEGYDASHWAMDSISSLGLVAEEHEQWRQTLQRLMTHHPKPDTRSHARYLLAEELWLQGETEAARLVQAPLRMEWDWRIIGAWDNDQGKGFDEVFPPEQEIDFQATYEGSLREIQWRKPVRSPVGPELNFGEMITPSRWSVAYGLAHFQVRAPGRMELRVSTGSPLKVWIDGKPIFFAQVIKNIDFDQFVVPVDLAVGQHRLLVKSAQEQSTWQLDLRFTKPDGGPIEKISPLPADCCLRLPSKSIAGSPVTPADLYAEHSRELSEDDSLGPVRSRVLQWLLAERMGLRSEALATSDELLQAAPKSLLARYIRAQSAWRHGERGKTSDLLESLAKSYGDKLLFLPLQHARFLRQEGLQRQARQVLEQARLNQTPEAASALTLGWSQQFAHQNWIEDECRSLEEVVAIRPQIAVQLRLAKCYEQLHFHARARKIYLRLLDVMPGYRPALEGMFYQELKQEHFSGAQHYGERLVTQQPHRIGPYLRLAELQRRMEALGPAEPYLSKAIQIDPDSPAPWGVRAKVLYQTGQVEQAVEAWRETLARDPDNDTVAQRLAWLAPGDEGPWMNDVPAEQLIRAALERRDGSAHPGAHILNLLDHEVTVVKADGSTSDVVTLVVRALDATGIDELTSISLRRGGRLRVLSAYALDAQGNRTQVSTIRNRTARFRNLSVGSTVVLQYRHEAQPVSYLSRYIARSWWFQSHGAHTSESQWVLWLPGDNTLHEWVNDPESQVVREESTVDMYRRITWTAKEMDAVTPEPGMPTAREIATNLIVSTVPDWDTFLEWEKALLTDAFRETADIISLAKNIVGEAQTPKEKALRIHRWLMEEIRYQQDYETTIAGVRPHAAPVVVERSYGDCKDKSVLFITLAKQVGLRAEFALLRTRPRGPLLRDIPMQQFDHAIVYVPKQPGLDDGFFIDSTADALDLTALRQDDTGVPALVFDTDSRVHTWRDIPFRAPAENQQTLTTELSVERTGRAQGSLDMYAEGMTGSHLRRLARNTQAVKQAMQGFVARLYGGAVARSVDVVEWEDLTRPAHLHIELQVGAFARKERGSLRVSLPPIWDPKSVFSLETRNYPLLLGVPQAMTWETKLHVPGGYRMRHSPADIQLRAQCFLYERRSQRQHRDVHITQRFETTCERIGVRNYAEHRVQAEKMIQALDEEWVFAR